MYKRITYILGVLFLASLILGMQLSIVSADSGQRWYLTSIGKPGGAPTANDGKDHYRDSLMNLGSYNGTGTYFELSNDKVVWFYANTGAQCNLAFGENSWTAHIRTEGIDGAEIGSNLTLDICKLEKDTGAVTILASHTETLSAQYTGNLTCSDNGATTQDFNSGDWLAIRLSWDCSSESESLRIYFTKVAGSYSDYSYINSPDTEFSYPTPELPALILLSSGLIILSGYIWWKYNKQYKLHKTSAYSISK